MNWEAIGAVGEVAGAIGVIATLLYLTIQIRASSQATEAQASANLSVEMERLLVALSQNDALANAMVNARKGEPLTEVEALKLQYWFGGLLRVCGSHLLQGNRGALSYDVEEPLSNILRNHAEVDVFREIMEGTVKYRRASSEFLGWLESEVLAK
jgi:hypothetical protein